jgi:4-hydroxy-2-oxoheptanedioate aldolase
MKLEKIKAFKKMTKERYAIGMFSKTTDPAFIEIMGHGNIDFVIIDLEHGPNTIQNTQNLIRAAEVVDLIPIVRTKEGNYNNIGECLDIGAAGVQVPQITDADKALKVIQHAKFLPDGMRGVCRFVRASEYSHIDKFDYFKAANETIVILQLEGIEAIENINKILEVEGIDVIFIGSYDLSQSLGLPGQITSLEVTKRMEEIIGKCLSKGVTVGTFADTCEDAERWISLGVKYIAYSVDVGLFYDKCREVSSKLRSYKQIIKFNSLC